MAETTLIENFPAGRLTAAREALAAVHARLVKAAAKSGAAVPEAPALVVVAERTVARCTACRQLQPATKLGDGGVGMCGLDTGETVMCLGMLRGVNVVDLEVAIGRPALAGWEFMAVIEPLTGGNLVKRVPGSDTEFDLSAYRTCDAGTCDHCNTVRARSETFVVKADGTDPNVAADTVKKVGRNCLEVFLGGKSAAAILARLGFADIVREVGFGDGEGGGCYVEPTFAPLEVLEWTVAVVGKDGFVSKKVAEATMKGSTADQVSYLLTPPGGAGGFDKWRKARDSYRPTAEDKAKASATAAWVAGLDGKTDYEYSLKLLVGEPVITTRKFGFVCSAVSSYERAMGREVARKKAATTSKHLGTVKEKLVVTVTVEKVIDLDGNYGVSHLHKMVDSEGNVVTWNTGTERLDVGKTVALQGTVKAHNTYKDVAETVLTRCKEVPVGTVPKQTKPKAKKAKVETHKCTKCGVPVVHNGTMCGVCTKRDAMEQSPGRSVTETEDDYLAGCVTPAKLTELELRNHPHTKTDGSWWEYDAQGIPLKRVCSECRAVKLASYRPEILSGYGQADVDERIDDDY